MKIDIADCILKNISAKDIDMTKTGPLYDAIDENNLVGYQICSSDNTKCVTFLKKEYIAIEEQNVDHIVGMDIINMALIEIELKKILANN